MEETLRQEWDEFNGALEAGLQAMDLAVPEDQRQRLFEHYRLVVEVNRQFNLTRITSPTDAAIKHYADSLSLLATPWFREGITVRQVGEPPALCRRSSAREESPLEIDDSREGIPAERGAGKDSRTSGEEGRGKDSRTSQFDEPPALCRRSSAPRTRGVARIKVLDVGTGAGYPAVPLAVVCPAWSVTAIDGTGKKVRFVEESAAALGLTNLDAMQARAADLVREGDWRFSLVLVRAVGQMDKVLAETVPLIGSSGAVVFYKTAHLEQAEADAAAAVADQMRLRMDAHRVDLPLGGEVLARQLIRFRRDAGSGKR